jgi:hypothetical protein
VEKWNPDGKLLKIKYKKAIAAVQNTVQNLCKSDLPCGAFG